MELVETFLMKLNRAGDPPGLARGLLDTHFCETYSFSFAV